jgi:hypothetical protein
MALPDRIYGQASPISIGGRSLFESGGRIRPINALSFSSPPALAHAAADRLTDAGFEILQVGPIAINFVADPDSIERTTRTRLVERRVKRMNGGMATFIDSPDTQLLGHLSTFGTPLADVVEGIALEVPRDLFGASATAPAATYPHLRVPEGVAEATNATQLHAWGVRGAGVKVAMVDSGQYDHPFFRQRGYRVGPVTVAPGASAPERDESGHGTGESANIFAIAPDCELLPVKANFANTIAAFNAAVWLNPDIITCSWGSHAPFMLSAADMVLSASVASAVARGIVVIFAAGNGHAGFPGQHPDVISAGGVLMHPDGSMEASNYSSGFTSQIFAGRRVPDVCGLVGARPRAIYIMLPLEPGSAIDVDNSNSVFPDGDETLPDDGWAAFSGTSAAAPQVAGAAALIKQVAPLATPTDVRDILASTARDVTGGLCSAVPDLHGGLPAGPGIDDATGPGLLDVQAAVIDAYVRSVFGMISLSAGVLEANLTVGAYYKGLADAMTWGASVWPDEALASYLQSVAAASESLAERYWTAASAPTH